MSAIYHFLIDRRTLVVLVLTGTLVGGLLFFAGLLVGLHQNLEPELAQSPAAPAAGAIEASPQPGSGSAAAAARTPVRAPAVTVQTPPAPRLPQPFVRTSAPAPRPIPAPRMTARLPSARAPVRVSATGAAAGATTGAATAPETGPEAAPGEETETAPGTEVAAPREPAPAPAPRPAQPEPPEPIVLPAMYSIQVGAYREPRYFEAARQDLEDRGYAPYQVEVTGAGGLVFQTLRIGRYRTRDDAIRAASEFQHREDMTALVRTVPAELLEPQPSLDTAGLLSGREPSARLAGL